MITRNSCCSLLTHNWMLRYTNTPYQCSLSLLVRCSQESRHWQNSTAAKTHVGLQLIITEHSSVTITPVITTCHQKSLLEPKFPPPFHGWSRESLSISLSTAPWCTGCRQGSQKQCCSQQCFSKIRFHGILRQLLCFACPENTARSQGCYVQIPFNRRDHMRQQRFPLIMNQFSANRPMWGISIYVWRSLGLIEVPHLQRTLN